MKTIKLVSRSEWAEIEQTLTTEQRASVETLQAMVSGDDIILIAPNQ